MNLNLLQFDLARTIEQTYGPLIAIAVNAACEKAARDWTETDTKRYGTLVRKVLKENWERE